MLPTDINMCYKVAFVNTFFINFLFMFLNVLTRLFHIPSTSKGKRLAVWSILLGIQLGASVVVYPDTIVILRVFFRWHRVPTVYRLAVDVYGAVISLVWLLGAEVVVDMLIALKKHASRKSKR